MPLTPFQAGIFKVISANRNPDSFVAGGIVINRDNRSARFSDDIDVFHDSANAVAASADADAEALRKAGYNVTFLRREATFQQAEVSRADDTIRLDWAADSAFRFFPIVKDEALGFRLHDADAATNKVLAAVGRQKVRDFIDLMQLDRDYISLGIAVWGASAKDEGYTSNLIMQELRRNSRINPVTLGEVTLAQPETAITLKADWLARFAAAEKLIATIPPEPICCLYLDRNGQPARGEVFDPSWVPHYGSVKGAWPKIVEP
jgi:hypothetical protein